MFRFLKVSLFILVIFIVGISLGSYYSPLIKDLLKSSGDRIYQETRTQEIHFCPPPSDVVKHQYDPDTFQIGALFWQMEYEGWKAPEKIGFMQALINQNNNLVCYYQWPNPKEKGTNLWMTIRLSPSVNQIVKSHGQHWSTQQGQALCNSGINACAFALTESLKSN